jgi:hypothetical protein
MQKTIRGNKRQWEALIFRPILPDGWVVEEQLTSDRISSISFIKWAKKHHKANPEKIYIIFNEFNLHSDRNSVKYQYTVRGGRFVKPSEELRYFTDLKSAENYILHLCESTDKWIEEVNSEETIRAYEKRFEKN